MENTKLTVEEVEKLQDIQQKNAAVARELGNLEITKLQIDARREEIIKYLEDLGYEGEIWVPLPEFKRYR